MAVASAALLLSTSLAATFLADLPPVRAVALGILVVAHSVLIAFVRHLPLASLAGMMATAVAVTLAGLPSLVLGLSPLIGTYLLAASTPLGRALAGLLLALTATAVTATAVEAMAASTVLSNLVALSVAWTLGRLSAQRTANIQALRDRADALEEARTALADRAVAEERLRIARELHDIIAHGLGVITIQAGVAAHVDLPEREAKRTLMSIEHLSRQATEEMRNVLTVLRGNGGHEADRHPLPDERGLPALLKTFEDAGLTVDLQTGGISAPLPPTIGLAVHRIVQEGLTNVLKHGGTTRARVDVARRDDALVIEVADDGGGLRPTSAQGHGLVGMRERVQALGGTLSTGPGPTGAGFLLRAVLPDPHAGDDRTLVAE